jgi:hypothetical protein
MSIFPAQIEARHRGRNDIAHAVSDDPPEAACIGAICYSG